MRVKLTLFIAMFCLSTEIRCLLAQSPDDLFDGDVLHEIRIYMHPGDWTDLRRRVLEDTYYPIEFHWLFKGTDITLPQVAARSRGSGSRTALKPSFKIDFNRYESDMTFLGFQSLVLRNNAQDASMLHERIAMDFFRRLGLPAPREVHTRLFVNDIYMGVYSIVEQIDSVFVQQHFGEPEGRLYSYQWADVFVFERRGSNPLNYSPVPFEPENDFFTPDPVLGMMVRAINEASDVEFSSIVGRYIDLNSFFTQIAAENFVAEQDGLLGNWGLNNFYLYRFRDSPQSIFLPWDKSHAFSSFRFPIFHNFESNVLTARSLRVAPEWIAFYRTVLQRAADLAGGPGGWMELEITRVYEQIRNAVREDPAKVCDSRDLGMHPCTNEEFEASIQSMLEFARRRSQVVREELGTP